MSKKSRRRNRALAAIAGLMGAKALGVLGSKSTITGATGENKRLFTDIKKTTKAIGPQKVNVKPKFPLKSVNFKGEVIEKGKNLGVGNEKTKFINRSPEKGKVGIYQGGKKVSDLNQKSINVLSDGKISTGGKTFENKQEYAKFKKAERATKSNAMKKTTTKKNPGFFGFTFDKPLLNKGSMIKARGGGMAKTKPTKLY